MENIPTAEELALSIYQPIHMGCNEFAIKLAIQFAKLHVEAALKEASEKAKIHSEQIITLGGRRYEESVDKDSILNAYPLTNIK